MTEPGNSVVSKGRRLRYATKKVLRWFCSGLHASLKCKWNFGFHYNTVKREGLYPTEVLLSVVVSLLL